jgi:hypothetical protein
VTALAGIMEDEQPTENQSAQREVDRILLRLRQSKAFIRAVGLTMGNGGYGSIKMDIARGKVKRIVSEAVFLEED